MAIGEKTEYLLFRSDAQGIKGVNYMTEIETIARAQIYLEKLVNGVNPLTNEEVAGNDVVNNVRTSI